jgi:hypothetical protein
VGAKAPRFGMCGRWNSGTKLLNLIDVQVPAFAVVHDDSDIVILANFFDGACRNRSLLQVALPRGHLNSIALFVHCNTSDWAYSNMRGSGFKNSIPEFLLQLDRKLDATSAQRTIFNRQT